MKLTKAKRQELNKYMTRAILGFRKKLGIKFVERDKCSHSVEDQITGHFNTTYGCMGFGVCGKCGIDTNKII